MPYTDLAAALARAKERSGAATTDDAYLTELLEMSAGIDSADTTHYRPFFVAAKFLEQNLANQALSEAKGVKFTGQVTPIASLFALQAQYDAAYSLAVPEGFEIPVAEAPAKRSTRSYTPTYTP